MSDLKAQSGQTVKKRNRLTVVCSNCKRRKSKCDRKQPCSNCVRLGDQDTCCYISLHPGEAGAEEISKVQKKTVRASINKDQVNRVSGIPGNLNEDAPVGEPLELINVIPGGFLVSVKRSAATEYSLFTDVSMEHRDPYLKCLITFRHIAIGMTVKNLKKNNVNLNFNPSLPQSFTPLSIFDADGDPLSSEGAFRQLQLIHKSLFDKFGSYRKYDALKYDDDESFVAQNLPSRILFFNEILPHFVAHVFSLIPIFDMRILTYEINSFYDTWEGRGKLSIKDFDHVVYSMVLLITKICQLSMNLSKLSAKIQFPLRDLNTSKYVSIVNHFLFKMKSLRKCTLLQLQCLILLRFYYWCGPEDGDGAEHQHSRILLGTVIASCKEMGINWNALLSPDDYFFELHEQSRPDPSIMTPEDYKRIYKAIWSYVLFWDRKMCFINGQECLITKSFHYVCTSENATWYEKIAALDYIFKNISDLLNDAPTRVDIKLLYRELAKARNLFFKLKTEDNKTLDFEYELLLSVFELCLIHAEMINYELKNDAEKFSNTIQKLWGHIVHLSHISLSYFNDEGDQFDSFARYYTNKAMAAAANKICVLIPTMILRFNRFSSLGFAERDILVKFLFGFSSLYFTEFGFDYYRCFKKMFTAKITYKILNRPPDKDSWVIILEFLLHELKRELSGKVGDEKNVRGTMPLLVKLREALSNIPKHERNVLKTWNEQILPIGGSKNVQGFNLYVDQLHPFLVDLFSNSFNLFASFYDNASSRLVDGTENSKSNENPQILTNSPNTDIEDVGIPSNGDNSTTSSNADLELANLELIQDLFEPFDFVSFF